MCAWTLLTLQDCIEILIDSVCCFDQAFTLHIPDKLQCEQILISLLLFLEHLSQIPEEAWKLV